MHNLLKRLACVSAFAVATVGAYAETYSLMIGINDYPDVLGSDGKPAKDKNGNPIDLDLFGPVNDIKAYKDVMVNRFGVKPDNIKTLLDKQAGETGFVEGMKWILGNAKAGDQVVFVYSGHGSQIPDKAEEDGFEEVIVLADRKLVPGDLFGEIAKALSTRGVNATFIFDSCYSGGMSRNVFSYEGQTGTLRQRFAPTAVTKDWTKVADARVAEFRSVARQGTASATAGSYAFLMAGSEDQPTTDLDFKDPATEDRGLFSLVLTSVLDKIADAPIDELMPAIAKVLKDKGFEQKPIFDLSAADRGKLPVVLK